MASLTEAEDGAIAELQVDCAGRGFKAKLLSCLATPSTMVISHGRSPMWNLEFSPSHDAVGVLLQRLGPGPRHNAGLTRRPLLSLLNDGADEVSSRLQQ